MPSKRVTTPFTMLIGGVLGLALATPLATSRLTSAKEAPPVDKKQNQVKQAADISTTFQQVAEKLRPALVSINSIKRVPLTQRQSDGSAFGFDFPFPRRENSDRQSVDEFFQDRTAERDLELQGLGTGIIVGREGQILTNSHVVLGADQVTVKLFDGRVFKAKTIGIDSPTEVAVLKIEASQLTAAELGDSDEANVGEWVLAMGSPFGLDQTVTAGIISAKGRSNLGIAGYEDFLQTDAAINPGNSGGPLVNLNGKVIGINTAIASRSGGFAGIGFAIPINMARLVMDNILHEGRVQRGWLGVVIQELDDNLARSFGFNDGGGLLISDMAPNGPIKAAGLRPGDIITKFNGKPVRSRNQFRNEVATHKPGTKVEIEFFRDGKHSSKTVQLGELPSRENTVDPSAAPKPAPPDSSADLGLRVRPLTPEIARQLGHDRPDGIVVAGVEPGGLAAKAGIRPKDIILSIGNQPIQTVEEFQAAVRRPDLERGLRMQLRSDGLLRFVLLRAE